MLNFFKGSEKKEEKIILDSNNIPKHIAIIMDGNGRWAKDRGLARMLGHREGMKTIKRILNRASDLGVKYLTLYAFSTENWKRPKEEVGALMKLIIEFAHKECEDLKKNNVIVKTIGDLDKLPNTSLEAINMLKEETKNNTGIVLNIALNYGGRDEIIVATKEICKQLLNGKISIDDINEELVNNNLYTAGMPDPDLIIRPSGEQRLSNYLLWQSAYSEFWYSNIKWPDFSEKDLERAIYDYQNRDRRFGAVK
ncbi:isoprenyl transferase [Clostridium senegalense]|uniref:isoprenyl transferase n=1 Tax=Clostridium senegalense TaxID=1465809 RepID=UPI000288CD75|nr:isoprenyl transferase [Clostridium senegalense]